MKRLNAIVPAVFPILLAITGTLVLLLRLRAYCEEVTRKSRAKWQQIAGEFGLDHIGKVYIWKEDGWDGEVLLQGRSHGRSVRVCEECNVDVRSSEIVVYVDGVYTRAGRGGADEVRHVRDVLNDLLRPSTATGAIASPR